MALDKFWQTVDASLDKIEELQPDTAQRVIDILNEFHLSASGKVRQPGARQAFFPGSGGDRQLMDALYEAGWFVPRAEAHYFYKARHTGTKEELTYIEGDVYSGDHMPVEGEF